MVNQSCTVLDSNACRNCRRPISLLAGVGWVHGELPKYAHGQTTCTLPVPVDLRCPVCYVLQPTDSRRHIAWHDHPNGGPCPGISQVGILPRMGSD